MKRSRRQLLALAAVIVAAAASLATSEGAPGVNQEPKDRLSFSGGQRTEVRHVRIEVVAGEGNAHVVADVPIDTGAVNGKRPVVLTVIRDSDGQSVLDDYGPDYHAGFIASLAGTFDAIDVCPRGQTCAETFTFTFQRIPEDPRDSLAFDWSVRTVSGYPEREPGTSPPPGAALTVTISR